MPWQRDSNSIDNLRFGGFRYKNRRRRQRTTTIVAAGSVFENDAAAWAREHLNFHPNCKQQQVLATNTRRGILNCTRQWGKSTTCAIKAVHYAHFHPESKVIVASPSQRQSSEFLRKSAKRPSECSACAPEAMGITRALCCCRTALASLACPRTKTPSRLRQRRPHAHR